MEDTAWKAHWRPAMAYTYMFICLFDFVIAPSINYAFFHINPGITFDHWTPLTLTAGGLFHAAMCAVLGISAWTRGSEKLERLKGR